MGYTKTEDITRKSMNNKCDPSKISSIITVLKTRGYTGPLPVEEAAKIMCSSEKQFGPGGGQAIKSYPY
jgi:anthranilate phosphoribosyltransferase